MAIEQIATDSLQDSNVAAALGQKSYNELVEQLVMVLGDATPKKLLTPQLSRRTSEYSTPRRTSSGLGTVGPSDLLSPTEIVPPLRQASDTQKAAAPSSGSGAGAVASQSEHDAQPASSALDTSTTAPLGTMTSSASTHASLHEAGEAGGPAGSLASVQQPAGSHDSPSSLPAESASGGSQESHPYCAQFPAASNQLRRPLMSPAADMASRAYSLPAAQSEEGAPSTPQSSDTFDAHIATAPTPYPSLASDFSQPESPASPQVRGSLAAALKASRAPMGKASTGSPGPGNSSDSKSRLALTTSGQGSSSEESVAATDDQGAFQSKSAADNQAGASSTASEVTSAPQNGGTAASEQLADGAQGLSLSDVNPNSVSEQDQQASASSDVNLVGLKLENADSEQLKLALAISLGQQEGEAAQQTAPGPAQPHDQPSVASRPLQTGPMPETLPAEPTLPATGSHTSLTDESSSALPAPVTVEASSAGNSSTQTAALLATPAGSTAQGQHAEPAPPEVIPNNATQQTPDQAAPCVHEAFSSSAAPGLAQPGIPDQPQPHLLAAEAGASQQQGRDVHEHAGQPDGDDGTPQQPSPRDMILPSVSLSDFNMHNGQETLQLSCFLSAVLFAVSLTWWKCPHALQCCFS